MSDVDSTRDAELSLFEEQLSRWLEVFLARCAPDARVAPEVRQVLEATLDASELAPEEEAQIVAEYSGLGDPESLPQVLAQLRVKRAITAAVRAACAGVGIKRPPPAPDVLIVSCDSEKPDSAFAQTVVLQVATQRAGAASKTPTRRGATGKAGNPGTLILSDSEALRELQKAGPVEIGNSAFAPTFPLLGNTPVSTSSPSSSGAVEVIEASALARTQVLQKSFKKLADRKVEELQLERHLVGDKYRIVRLVGEGGMGRVFEARNKEFEEFDIRVAIKVMRQARDPHLLDMFLQEARKVTQLKHKNIIEWKDVGKSDAGYVYFVMEFLEGEDLEEFCQKRAALSPDLTKHILLQILEALRHAHHQKSILHLDLKPGNVFVLDGPEDQEFPDVKVIDFGMGQFVAREEPKSKRAPVVSAPATTSRAIQRCLGGTWEYASPEQCAHMVGQERISALDGRADLYSLGIMGFRMLTGEFPFEAPSNRNPRDSSERARTWATLHREVAPRTARSMGIKGRLGRFLDRCLEKDRENRWKDTHQAFKHLYRIVHPPVWKTVVKVSAPLAAAAALVVWLLVPPPEGKLPLLYGDQDVEKKTIYFGPHRPQAKLSVEGRDLPIGVLVELAPTKVQSLEGWAIRSIAPNQFGIHADSPSARSVEVRVRARSQGGFIETILSKFDASKHIREASGSFSLVYLAADSLALEPDDDLTVGGRPLGEIRRGRLRVDPTNQDLELGFHGFASEHLSSVKINERRLLRIPDDSIGDGSARYAIDMDELNLRSGESSLRIQAEDLAGQSYPPLHALLEVFAEPLRVGADGRRIESATNLRGNEYLFTKGQDPRIVVTLNGRADLAETPRITGAFQLRLGERPPKGSTRFVIPFSAADPEGTSRGEIELAFTDRDYVFRKNPERGSWSETFEVTYESIPLGFAVSLGGPLVPGENYFRGREARLRISKQSFSGECALKVTMTTSSKDPVVVIDNILTVRDGDTSENLTFPIDGLYALHVQGYRLEEEGGAAVATAEFDVEFRLYVDNEPPRLNLTTAREMVGVDDLQVIALAIDDAVAIESVRAQLKRPGRGTPLELSAAEEHGVWQFCETPEWYIEDGAYSLSVEVADKAQNLSRIETTWEAAKQPPVVELREPGKSREVWKPRFRLGKREFPVRVVASDPNGVVSVGCTVRSTRDGESSRTVQLAPVGSDTSSDPIEASWEGAVPLGAFWSEAEVELSVEASDRHGIPTRETLATLVLDFIPEEFPRCIETFFANRRPVSVSRMLVFDTQELEEYIFGGRGRDAENQDFRGIVGESFESCRFSFKKGELQVPSFYLDEHEVSCRQYREFLNASDGFRNRDNWPHGQLPSDLAQSQEKLTELAGQGDDAPMAGITWDEAYAYARWVGKRLPTLVEWEYAMRHGKDYLPFACYRRGENSEALRRINYGGRRPNPEEVLRGSDVCLEGVHDLCGNLREWTANPRTLWRPGDGEKPEAQGLREHYATRLPGLLDPHDWLDDTQYYVVGGSYRKKGFSFVEMHPVPRHRTRQLWHLVDVGFRCAIDAADVRVDLDQGALALDRRTRFRECNSSQK